MTPDAKTPEQIAWEIIKNVERSGLSSPYDYAKALAAAIRQEREAKVQDDYQSLYSQLMGYIGTNDHAFALETILDWHAQPRPASTTAVKDVALFAEILPKHNMRTGERVDFSVGDEELEQLAKSKCVFSNSGKRGFRIGYRAAEAKQVWPSEDVVLEAAHIMGVQEYQLGEPLTSTLALARENGAIKMYRWLKARLGGGDGR